MPPFKNPCRLEQSGGTAVSFQPVFADSWSLAGFSRVYPGEEVLGRNAPRQDSQELNRGAIGSEKLLARGTARAMLEEFSHLNFGSPHSITFEAQEIGQVILEAAANTVGAGIGAERLMETWAR